ncbi:phage tail sheath subtilisin-like domain-containing protein [Fluviibacterium sp. DFM31]|uniref:Phage tail sheath subtilisin-like domain-containing protein n=1 Tax=Meridianimarinicoccus marinus TaxID=3231483 RepID=A0ABV3L7C2_9RHOB
MPEYLAPGVYIEEVSSGNKPIEGASTSTAGMVGFTQRGPENTPTLVTSFGAFNRVFGGFIDHATLADPASGLDMLPYAVQGFFGNGGARLYVNRIVGTNATTASVQVHGTDLTQGVSTTMVGAAALGAGTIAIEDASNVAAGTVLLISDDDRTELVTATGPATGTRLLVNAPFAQAGADDDAVTVQTFTDGANFPVSGDMVAGATALALTDPTGIAAGDILRVSDTGNPDLTEYVIATTLDLPDVDQALLFAHPAATTVVDVVTAAAGAATQLDGASVAGAAALDVDPQPSIAAGDIVRLGNAFRRVLSAAETVPVSALTESHGDGVTVTASVPMFEAHARFRGAWGNDMQVRTERSSLVETATAAAAGTGETVVMLDSAFGLYEGSVLEFSTGERATVASVNRVSGEVVLTGSLGTGVGPGTVVRSVEFHLIAERIENGKVAESELFENLSMNSDHPRYAPTIVGRFDRAAIAGRESGNAGGSELIRLSDRTVDDAGVDVATADDGRIATPVAAVIWPMVGGTDDDASIDSNTFIGTASDDPGDRTGIQALENESSISIVAVPGQTDISLQKALLNHCAKMRYRFAVVETDVGDRLADARGHRQNFDTTYGAIYYPWLVIPDRFGDPGDILKIPPAGHVAGIYARTDINRGVWKAPANEVVRGILGFETALTKGEQDILNPIHVNCFRDFRTANRGLRLWGARTLSSDPEWKYVNVRRLLLFIEQSLDNGLQWAVFEPNAEPLWASVKQSISGFLTGIWRDGGLEGTSEEEAYFVNVGYNITMTQADIDNGRLIVEVGVAAVKPAEFVIIRIGQKTREATS